MQDHFYREISRIDEILDGFASFLSHCIRADSPRHLFANMTSVNAVVITMVSEVLNARNKKAAEFAPPAAAQLEYLPWTAARREQLLQLSKLSLQYGLPAAENAAQRGRLVEAGWGRWGEVRERWVKRRKCSLFTSARGARHGRCSK